MKWFLALLFLLWPISAWPQASMTQPIANLTSFNTPSSNVAGLPTCNAASTNMVITVTNALTPTIGLAVVGGGAVVILVHCNGTSWIIG